jgi:hypothetical protein
LRWVGFSLLGILGAGALVYLGDYATFLLRGEPLDQLTVTRYMAAPLKGDKTAYYFEGTGPMSCSKSVFPQSGWSPCWYLRRHPLAADSD